jgi:hypothetical protein
LPHEPHAASRPRHALITVAVGLSAMGDWLAIAPLSLHLAEVVVSMLVGLVGMAVYRRSTASTPASAGGAAATAGA